MTTPFTSHRKKPSLLIPSKRALFAQRKAATSSFGVSASPPPTLVIRSSASTETQAAATAANHLQDQSKTENREEKSQGPENRTIEADFSAAPQPFLDPPLWERMKSAGGE
ncbi:hypothetical protein ASPVEDRAFT_43097 [Aspergillus versicolor CBS 583.65]|uniref:Uncharacterized protein n=1 Tax=Aspergillus versicolor CBS 583.65 TaxID=1036611 RepID=A0A1L9PQA3_ASPVE|nr:uncharacterized protein ASPVEDRAFT_43097 [Aspergillus versicolor CBS 583.65]OJJ03615.1 hypothetical protein ASPVEDRAFT_43097 [Aspergillus versicolor CBS 583.65]